MNSATFRMHLANAKLPRYCRMLDKDCPLDRWISYAVKVLRDNGVETFESCDAGRGHCFPEPTIRFHGGHCEGLRAVAIAQTFGLPVADLRRRWVLQDGELVGPEWQMTFVRSRLVRLQRQAERGGLIA